MDPKNNVATYVAHRAKEPTTWAGLVPLIFGVVQAFSSGDIAGAGASAALVIAGLVSIFSKERK